VIQTIQIVMNVTEIVFNLKIQTRGMNN